jgi:hypothetical protein
MTALFALMCKAEIKLGSSNVTVDKLRQAGAPETSLLTTAVRESGVSCGVMVQPFEVKTQDAGCRQKVAHSHEYPHPSPQLTLFADQVPAAANTRACTEVHSAVPDFASTKAARHPSYTISHGSWQCWGAEEPGKGQCTGWSSVLLVQGFCCRLNCEHSCTLYRQTPPSSLLVRLLMKHVWLHAAGSSRCFL